MKCMSVAVSAALNYLNLLFSYEAYSYYNTMEINCCIRGVCGGMFKELIAIVLMAIQHFF